MGGWQAICLIWSGVHVFLGSEVNARTSSFRMKNGIAAVRPFIFRLMPCDRMDRVFICSLVCCAAVFAVGTKSHSGQTFNLSLHSNTFAPPSLFHWIIPHVVLYDMH